MINKNEEHLKYSKEVVNEFLSIMDGWLKPDDYKRLEDKANEFLFEGIMRVLAKVALRAKEEVEKSFIETIPDNSLRITIKIRQGEQIESIFNLTSLQQLKESKMDAMPLILEEVLRKIMVESKILPSTN